MGADVIRVSVMLIGELARTREISCTGAEVTLHVMSGIGTEAGRFLTSNVLFETTSFGSSASGSQKNENLGVTLFISSVSGLQKNENLGVTLFISSALGSQRKENSETTFLHEGTGDVIIFVEGAMRTEAIC